MPCPICNIFVLSNPTVPGHPAAPHKHPRAIQLPAGNRPGHGKPAERFAQDPGLTGGSGFQPRKGHGPHEQSAPGRVRDQSLRVGDPTQTTRHEPLGVRARENPEVKSHAPRPPESRDGGHRVAGTSATTAPQLRAKDFPNFRDPDPEPPMIRTAAGAPCAPSPAPRARPVPAQQGGTHRAKSPPRVAGVHAD